MLLSYPWHGMAYSGFRCLLSTRQYCFVVFAREEVMSKQGKWGSGQGPRLGRK